MNTKTDEISSGLVAVAWIDYSLNPTHKASLHFIPVDLTNHDIAAGFRCDPLVRLSDAEEIIAAKGAEIERLNGECDRLAKAASKNYRDNGLPINEEFYKQAERIEKQAAALKLARPLVKNATYSFIDSVKANEALAAIDALGE